MASLRARLLAALLALTLLGLVLLGGITYAEQHSFLYDRVDDQTRAAIGPVAGALSELGVGPRSPRGGGRHGPPDGQRPGDHREGGPRFGLPRGTYGERRDASGRTLGIPVVINYSDQKITANPDIPRTVPVDRLITVSGKNGDTNRYRVIAQHDMFSGGVIIAAVPLHETDQTLHRLLLVESLVIVAVLLGLAALAWFLVRVGLRPLDRMTDTAGRIAGGDLSHRVESNDPRTEVGRLGLALNRMLDRLEEAFTERRQSEDRLRRFLADASHELRTPLTSIRGYAELFRLGAARDEAELAKAMRRIEDEAARMGVLVEDLLALARLDELPDAERKRVDVSQLAKDAVDDARATDPERPIVLRADDPVVTLGDPHQLRQVLANLLRNALVHTPPGTPVDVSVARNGDHVELAVRDHGRGLPEGDPAALFERFWRAAPGRERGKAGAGLGLAIVAGIVSVHGGNVRAEGASGGGARFVVRLPVAP